MIQLLIALAVVAMLYISYFGGNNEAEHKTEENPVNLYQQRTEMARELEHSTQQAAERRMQEMDRQINGKK